MIEDFSTMKEESLLSMFVWKGRKLSEPDDKRLTRSRCMIAGIVGKWLEAKWSYYPDHLMHKKLLQQYARHLDERRVDGQGIYVCGVSGTGKTFGSILLAKEVIRRDGFPFVIRYSDLFEIVTEREEIYQRVRLTPFLIVDDLGAGSAKQTVAAMFEELLRYREIYKLATIISSNMNKVELISGFGAPFVRVLEDTCPAIEFTEGFYAST